VTDSLIEHIRTTIRKTPVFKLPRIFQDNKVVLLEDLASHFGLRTQQAIDRVQEMLKDGILTGSLSVEQIFSRTALHFRGVHLFRNTHFSINSFEISSKTCRKKI